MSVRYLYNQPEAKRHCSWCSDPIKRNIAKTPDGRLWHYGCLMNARDASYQCQECWARFDGTEAAFQEDTGVCGDEWKLHRNVFCPHCGVQVQSRRIVGVIEA